MKYLEQKKDAVRQMLAGGLSLGPGIGLSKSDFKAMLRGRRNRIKKFFPLYFWHTEMETPERIELTYNEFEEIAYMLQRNSLN